MNLIDAVKWGDERGYKPHYNINVEPDELDKIFEVTVRYFKDDQLIGEKIVKDTGDNLIKCRLLMLKHGI